MMLKLWSPGLSAPLACGLLLAAAVSLSACAAKPSPENWQNPNVAKEEWSLDRGECRRMARREMEREAGLPASAPPPDNIGGGAQSFETSMNRFYLQRYQDKVFADCMRRLGYAPIAK